MTAATCPDAPADHRSVPRADGNGPVAARRKAAAGHFSLVMAAIDLILIFVWVTRHAGSMTVLVWHVFATLFIASLIWGIVRRNPDSLAGAALLCLLLGPIGGIVLAIADVGQRRPMHRSPVERQATAGGTRADRLHAQIVQDRRRQSNHVAPTTFAQIFRTGTLARQQEAIAAISLSYRSEMLPALRQALDSEIAAIRVQAAAVYAKLRGQFGDRAKAILAAASKGPVTADLTEEARHVAASGFVDAETAAELRAHATRRPAPSAHGGIASAAPRQRAALTRPPRVKRYSCGGLA